MLAIKENRCYPVNTEVEREAYVNKGYDIVDEKGEIIEYGVGKTVPYAEYMKVVNELKALKAKKEKKSEK